MSDPRITFSSTVFGPSSSLDWWPVTAGAVGRCLRCSWRSGLRLDGRAVRAAFREHLKAAHPGKTQALEVIYRVEGHCIRCAGAVYTERVDRPLVAVRHDEPTFPVNDGLDDRERLPFKRGWCSFDIATKKAPPRQPACPEHPEQWLRWYRIYPVSVEGRPVSDYMDVPA